MKRTVVTIGELRHRITFLRSEPVDDGLATVDDLPVREMTRRAKKIDVSDLERLRAGELGSELTSRFIVRADSLTRLVRPQSLIACGEATYSVTGVRDPDDRGRWIEISAVSRPDLLEPLS